MGHASNQYGRFIDVAVDRASPLTQHAWDGASAEHYRIYLMDCDDRVRSHRLIQCAHEEDALAEAVHLLADYPRVEVWTGARMVRRLTLP